MPLAHQIILAVMVMGFIAFPSVLLFVWVVTKGWRPMDKNLIGGPDVAWNDNVHDLAKAA